MFGNLPVVVFSCQVKFKKLNKQQNNNNNDKKQQPKSHKLGYSRWLTASRISAGFCRELYSEGYCAIF